MVSDPVGGRGLTSMPAFSKQTLAFFPLGSGAHYARRFRPKQQSTIAMAYCSAPIPGKKERFRPIY
jgi:hypothetical protein